MRAKQTNIEGVGILSISFWHPSLFNYACLEINHETKQNQKKKYSNPRNVCGRAEDDKRKGQPGWKDLNESSHCRVNCPLHFHVLCNATLAKKIWGKSLLPCGYWSHIKLTHPGLPGKSRCYTNLRSAAGVQHDSLGNGVGNTLVSSDRRSDAVSRDRSRKKAECWCFRCQVGEVRKKGKKHTHVIIFLSPKLLLEKVHPVQVVHPIVSNCSSSRGTRPKSTNYY